MITLGEIELAIAERISFSSQLDHWVGMYARKGFGLDESAYVKLQLRLIAMRCRKNGIVELENIEKFLNVFFRTELSAVQMCRLLEIAGDPAASESAKMAEISKQFLKERPTLQDGFAIWKMP
jgi:hypothetical protein